MDADVAYLTGRIKNDTSLSMEYANYRYTIVYQLGVELAGWPSWVEMARASKLSAEHARDIHQKLKSGAIHWVALTKSQRDAVAKEIEEQRAQGPLKPRKQRCDKDVIRGPRDKSKKNKDVRDGAAVNSATLTGALPSVTNAAVPSVTNAAGPSVPSVANTAVLSIANTAIPSVANAAVPATANDAPLATANAAVSFVAHNVPTGAIVAVPTPANETSLAAVNVAIPPALSITENGATLGNNFFDNLDNFDPAFDPCLFDFTQLDLSLTSLPPFANDQMPLPDMRLNTSNVGDGGGIGDEPATAFPMHLSVSASTTSTLSSSGAAFNVFSMNANTSAGNGSKRRREGDNLAAPEAKKARKTRRDAGMLRGPQKRAPTGNGGKRPRKTRSDAGVLRGPRAG
ncbi:hypothetical protein C8R45DRAFT_1209131 [Mycena sanguinolenta]|nr:hypothetical protein C8R45DRAFT_1209131 [Mycena sanguinolenta]